MKVILQSIFNFRIMNKLLFLKECFLESSSSYVYEMMPIKPSTVNHQSTRSLKKTLLDGLEREKHMQIESRG